MLYRKFSLENVFFSFSSLCSSTLLLHRLLDDSTCSNPSEVSQPAAKVVPLNAPSPPVPIKLTKLHQGRASTNHTHKQSNLSSYFKITIHSCTVNRNLCLKPLVS
uniref:(northern house mosquito) hypothetical protein n=1 Tax=Culex pipiens TaxID=7175 RepID=A0A8D8MXT3_CULPI